MADKHVYVFGDIGWEVRLNDVVAATQNTTAEDNLIVHIHSPGGDVMEGFAIHDYLRSLGAASIETRIEGLCASIATVIALAGDVRTMTENSTFFIHNPWTMGGGDAAELERVAAELRAIENRLAQFYSKKTGQETEGLLEMMKAETSMTASQAKELGFVTEIVTGVKAAARIKSNQQNPNTNSIMTTIEKKFAAFEGVLAAIGKKLGIKNEFTEAPKALLMTLQDGTTNINVATESDMPEVGNAVTMEDGSAAADGDYTLADGTVLTVVGGVITAVVEPVVDTESEEVKALKAENETLKNKVSEMEAKMETYAKSMEEIQAKLEATYTPKTERKPAFRAAAPKDTKQNMFSKDDLKRKPTK